MAGLRANLSTICETEFNRAAFRLRLSPAPAAWTVPAELDNAMQIATYNVNGINGRLANLLGWLQEAPGRRGSRRC
jgi:hypothetical protein